MVEPDGFLRFHTDTDIDALLSLGDDTIPYRNQYTDSLGDHADDCL